MGWVRFTCYYGPVLKRELHTLRVGVGSPPIKPKSYDKDTDRTRIKFGALKPSVFAKLLNIK